MLEALNLYIPSVTDNEAHQLLRFHRHVMKRWLLCVAPSGNWEIQYMRRYWSFLGHVCRQDFQSRYPARVVLHHIFQQHSQTLSRPGFWSTPHGLLTKFWLEIGLDVDRLHASLSDREHWKDLLSPFLAWQDLAPNRSDVEFLECSPWEHPQCLLRMHVKWLCAVFISLRKDSCAAA